MPSGKGVRCGTQVDMRGLTTAEKHAWEYNKEVVDVIGLGSMVDFGDSSFWGSAVRRLDWVGMRENLQRIGVGAFEYCTLEVAPAINGCICPLPSGLKVLDAGAFYRVTFTDFRGNKLDGVTLLVSDRLKMVNDNFGYGPFYNSNIKTVRAIPHAEYIAASDKYWSAKLAALEQVRASPFPLPSFPPETRARTHIPPILWRIRSLAVPRSPALLSLLGCRGAGIVPF